VRSTELSALECSVPSTKMRSTVRAAHLVTSTSTGPANRRRPTSIHPGHCEQAIGLQAGFRLWRDLARRSQRRLFLPSKSVLRGLVSRGGLPTGVVPGCLCIDGFADTTRLACCLGHGGANGTDTRRHRRPPLGGHPDRHTTALVASGPTRRLLTFVSPQGRPFMLYRNGVVMLPTRVRELVLSRFAAA
jgi:hypothetical protein